MIGYCEKEKWHLVPLINCRALHQQNNMNKCQKLRCQSFWRCLLVEKENIVFADKKEPGEDNIFITTSRKEIPACLHSS